MKLTTDVSLIKLFFVTDASAKTFLAYYLRLRLEPTHSGAHYCAPQYGCALGFNHKF